MADTRRMTTDRFYGGIDDRLDILADLLSLLDESDAETASVKNVIDWVYTNTNAEERSAVERHLGFIESVDLIERVDDRYELTRTGDCYRREQNPIILYNALRTGVKGFDTIVRALARGPLTDEDLMELLISEFEECNMGTSAVAKRHREWLQVLGYVEHEDGRNHLTDSGKAIADQLRGVSSLELEVGSVYERQELHDRYGGGILSGIAPSLDEPVVFLFSGGTGGEHGYRDEIRSDGMVIYTGEEQVGDMEMERRNRVIRDHVEEGRELHLFEMEDKGVRYVGQFLYAGHFYGELPDSRGESRRAIRFQLEPIDNTSTIPEPPMNPTVYQVPVKTGDGPIRTNFERTVVDGVPRSDVADVYDPPIDHDTLRVWGNQSDEPANTGDYLLFAGRDGRYDGDYTRLGRVAHATILDEETAAAFTDAVGWGEVTDKTYPHVMFLEPIYEADLDQDEFWELLGFGGWPNDTYSAINFDRREGHFSDEYDSVREFIDDIQGQQLYPEPSMTEYDSLAAACDDVRSKFSRTDEDTSWLTAHIGEAIIEDWSQALSGINPADEVDTATAGTLDQLRAVYESVETKLEHKADELEVGTLGALSPAQTLFLGSIRTIQEDRSLSGGVLNQPRLNSVLNTAYTVEECEIEDEHAVSAHIRDTEPTVYKFTAPPDYWITSVEYGSVSFEANHRDRWESIEAGDIAILHSRADPSTDEFEAQPAGLIGIGILGETFEKDESWWWDEYQGTKDFPLVAAFNRLFLTGDTSEIDSARDIIEKHRDDPTRIDRELGALTSNCLSIADANELSRSASGIEFPAQGMFGTFRTDDGEVDYDRTHALIEAMAADFTEVSTVNIHKSFDGALTDEADAILEGLHFPDGQGEDILEQIETALNAGKHVLLTGPPGTGKTEIAERVSKYLVSKHPYLFSGYEMTTATADWSTFDTVGGYMPSESAEDENNLSFNPGIVLNRLKDSATGAQSNELTIIDELNRADIDKAFGQLFTLLSGQSVQLPYTVDGKEVELTTYEDVIGGPAANQYVVPNSWRIFATMNAYDKTSLYEMSYAFMRRFAFVRIPAPELEEPTAPNQDPAADLVHQYATAWGIDIDPREAAAVGRVWRKTNTAVDERAIGPAIVEDVLRYVNQHTGDRLEYHLTQAVISYIFPQLEGVPKRKTIVRELADVQDIDQALLEGAAQEMLQVTLAENE